MVIFSNTYQYYSNSNLVFISILTPRLLACKPVRLQARSPVRLFACQPFSLSAF